MSPQMWIVAGAVVLVVILALLFVSIYNRLVQLRNRCENGFSQIDVQLKRRHDLIPNIVETAKGYMQHEQETLEAVTEARNQAVSAETKAAANPTDANAMQAMMGAEAMLGGALNRLLAVVESYPDLKADKQMMQVHEELVTTENRISFARQSYNDAIMNYNTRRESFPDTIVANMCGFHEGIYWEIEDPAEREAVKVSFTKESDDA